MSPDPFPSCLATPRHQLVSNPGDLLGQDSALRGSLLSLGLRVCSARQKSQGSTQGWQLPAKTQALLSPPRPQPKTTTAALVLGGTHPAWVAKGLPVPTRDAFIRVPLPMAEAGVKTHEEGWNIDLCATDGCGSAQGQHGQELMPQPQVPHSHVGDTRTGHTLPRLHQAPASTAMLRAQPQHQGPRRQHHQASPVRSPNTSINKTLALAAQTTNHKSILHDAQPVTAEQVRFSESTRRFLQRLSYLG